MSRFRRLRRDSRFESPKAVSLKVKLHIERKEGTTCPLLFPRVRPYLLSDVQVCKPKTLAVPRETLLTHYSLDASGNFEFLKKENHHVRIKQECRPPFVRRSLEQGQSASDRRAFCAQLCSS